MTIGVPSFVPAPFLVRSFRFQFAADLVTSAAFEMETLILGWFILVETDSVLLLSLFGALQSIGTLCAPLFGLGAERMGTRNLLALMRAAYACFALTLMACAFAGVLSPVVVLAIATLMGLVRPSDIAMRNLMVSDLMPPDKLFPALSISRMTQDLARIGGALTGAGLFVALGIGPAYVVVTLLYAASLGLTLRIPRPAARPRGSILASPFADLRDGFVHVRATPILLAALLLAFLVNLTAYPICGGLLAYIARDVYQLDQSGFGTLSASFALGGLAGSVALTLTQRVRSPAWLMIGSSLVWYALLLVFVQTAWLPLGIATLGLAGFVQNLCMIPMSLVILSNAGAGFRGRVMGMRMLAIYGLPLGLLAAGAMTSHISFAATGTLYCLLGAIVTAAIALHWRQALRQDASGRF
jgi:hypothetical protein